MDCPLGLDFPTQLSINVHIKAVEMKGRFVADGKQYRPVVGQHNQPLNTTQRQRLKS